MKDREKAIEIAEMSQFLSDFPHDYHSVEYGAMKMAEWKEKELIEKACKWFDENITNNPTKGLMAKYNRCITHGELLQEFRKAMEE